MLKIPSFLFTCVFFAQIIFAQNEPPRNIVDGKLGISLDGRMQTLSGNGFAGVLLIAKDGKIILEKGYGLADRDRQIAYNPDTVFDIGSITKQFTGAAILKLEMQGKLKTSDKITKYFKDVPADKARITIHQLLTHTAGFTDALGEDYVKLAREEMVRGAMASKLLFAPGERYEYSNVGYSLLGAIIETVSGKSYEKYLRDNLFKPAGMMRTGYLIPKWKRESLAVGYETDGKRWGTPLDQLWDQDGPYWNLRANGGILSTVSDLYKWHLALEGEKILSKAAKEKYYTPYVPEQPEKISFYGYGWVIQKTRRGTNLIWHNGGNPYFFADFRRYIDDRTIVIVATNTLKRELTGDFMKTVNSIFPAAPVSKAEEKK